MTAHVARFADGSGLLFDEELQLAAALSCDIRLPTDAKTQPSADAGLTRLTASQQAPAWRLHCRPAAIGRRLEPLRSTAPAVDASALTLNITVEPGRTTIAGPTACAVCHRADELLPLAKTVLLSELLAHDAVGLHAAALSRNEQCLLLAGPPGSGKSTLCAALLHAGYGYAADDVLLLKGGTIHGLPLPLALKQASWPILASRYPTLSHLTTHRRPDGALVKYLLPTPIPAPARAGWIVFPRYSGEATLRCEPIDQATAYTRLIAEAYSPSGRLAADAFHVFADWMQHACCYDLRYSRLDDALVALIALTDTPVAPSSH